MRALAVGVLVVVLVTWGVRVWTCRSDPPWRRRFGRHRLEEQQFQAAHQADLDIEAEEGVHFERAWLDPVSGKVFCVATGPNMDAVIRVHERAGHPAKETYQVPFEVRASRR